MKFSVGIPAYKLRFLGPCIDSVLAQTWQDFELIIVNDDSPEDIDGLVGEYRDSRIRYYRNKKNSGPENVVDNWNRCLDYAVGDFFVLMGDDDKMTVNYLEEFNKLISEYPDLDIYHCRSIIIDENSVPVGISSSWPEFESVYDNIWNRMNNGRDHFIADFVFRRMVLLRNKGFYKTELAWFADDISSYVAMDKKGVAHTNQTLLYYRQSDITITSSASVELKVKAIMKARNWLVQFLANNKASSSLDLLLTKLIERELNRYFKKNIIALFAYYDRNNTGRFKYFFTLWRKRNCYELSTKEIAYAFILTIKKQSAQKL